MGAFVHLYSTEGQERIEASDLPSKPKVMAFAKSPTLTTTPENTRLGAAVLERIGNTPLLRLEKVGREHPSVGIYAKAEWFNPGGSVKDRAAINMVRDGERSGAMRPGKTLLDATR